MFGAILGDIIGSRFEFDAPGWKKEFELFTKDSSWTDDTVMTIAVAEALMEAGENAGIFHIEEACVKSMQKWGRKYPGAGYGGRFRDWLRMHDPKPYGSYGNGSAMRVSSVGWLYDSLERTREVARATAIVSHNHPEGIKGAECTAAVIYMARTGHSKKEISDYVIKEFGYDFSESLEHMRARHRMDESCMDALPKALRSFMDGTSFEDTVRNAVSLGGDTDTIAAIAGAMADAFFGIPGDLLSECMMRVEDDMRKVLLWFDQVAKGDTNGKETDPYLANAPVKAAMLLFRDEEDDDKRANGFFTFLNHLAKRVSERARVPAPFVDVNNTFMKYIDPEKVKKGDIVTVAEEVRLKLDTMTDSNGKRWLPLFLDRQELEKGQTANITMPVEMETVLRNGLAWEDVEGVVIDPFGKPFTMNKELLEKFWRDYDHWKKERQGWPEE